MGPSMFHTIVLFEERFLKTSICGMDGTQWGPPKLNRHDKCFKDWVTPWQWNSIAGEPVGESKTPTEPLAGDTAGKATASGKAAAPHQAEPVD